MLYCGSDDLLIVGLGIDVLCFNNVLLFVVVV